MIMPNSRLNRAFWEARRARLGATPRSGHAVSAPGAIRVRVGHGLIGIGSWLSGDGVAPSPRSAHGRPA